MRLQERKVNKSICLRHVYTNMYLQQKEKDVLLIINLISVTGGRMVDRIHNYLLLPSLYFFCPQQVLQLNMALYMIGRVKSSFVQNLSHEEHYLDWVVFFHWPSSLGMVI